MLSKSSSKRQRRFQVCVNIGLTIWNKLVIHPELNITVFF